MRAIQRSTIVRSHFLLASFFMPIAIMYFISGVLYTLDIKGHVDKQIIPLKLAQPFTPDLEILTNITSQALIERSLALPKGEPVLKKKKGVYQMFWGDLKHAIKLQPTNNPMRARLTYRERNFLAQIMRIHRAESGLFFKIVAIALVSGLLIIIVSGVYMAQSIPGFKRPTYIAIASGFFMFLLMTTL